MVKTIIRITLFYFIFLFFSMPSVAVSVRRVTGSSIGADDKAAINWTFEELRREASNSVHKTMTETIGGDKTFTGDITFDQEITGTISTATAVSGTVQVENGGTGATTAAGARTSLDVPSTSGSGATGTWGIGISGNAGTATTATNLSGGTVNGTTGDFSGAVDVDGALSENTNRVFSGASMYESAETSLPAVNSTTTVNHGLGNVPRLVMVTIRCKSADVGYSVGDEVPFPASVGGGNVGGMAVYWNSTVIGFVLDDAAAVQGVGASVGSWQTIDPTKWKLIFRAWY